MALPFWVPRAELGSAPTRRLRDRLRLAAEEESNRLLYVALTRAADRLVVCGWEPGRKPGGTPPPGAWYPLCRKGFEAAGAASRPFALGWLGELLVLERTGVAEPAVPDAARAEPDGALPSWIGRAPSWQAGPPPSEPPLPRPLAPSRPDDVGLGPVPALRSPLDATSRGRGEAFRRGRLVHRLLQHLHEVPPGRRDAVALRFLQAGPEGLPPEEAAHVAAQLGRVLAHPDLAPLFAPDALVEQPIVGVVAGVVVSGQMDRLRVLPERVLLCDFKTNRRTPDTPEQVPVAYLRQMAAYRALLASLYPGRPINCTLVWTEDASVMPLGEALLRLHAPGTYRTAGHQGPGVPGAA